jgi:hypothetical protein
MMQALSKAAFQVDRYCQSHKFERLWKNNAFRRDLIDSQKNSMLMSLPPEIRLMIWKYVLSPPYDNSTNILSILASCRLVHGEAVVQALESTTFILGLSAGLEFQSKLWSLGTLTQHLRHIKVEISLKDSTARSANNPFLLSKLPLNYLNIDLGVVKTEHWADENFEYHRLMSALLYEESERRLFALYFLQLWVTKERLYKMLFGMQTKKMTVTCAKSGKDIIWSAFVHFRLVDSYCTTMRNADQDDGIRYIIFGDEEKPDANVVEMGRWPLKLEA